MDISKMEKIIVVKPNEQNHPLGEELNKNLASLPTGKVVSINNLPSDSADYDCILTVEQNFTDEQLNNLFKLLKPEGSLQIHRTNQISNLTFRLKSNGFIMDNSQNDQQILIAKKPAYEIGSAVKIDSKKIWSLAIGDEIGDDDLIDDDDLLDENDKAKPKAEDLKVCASTKQRKACANCSCGLKEELEKEEIDKIRSNTQNVKSSCGNCYLGDAFRCESCPYRGMPAFKPGEKVLIDNVDDL